MDINSDEEPSSIFQPFTTENVSKENANTNKSTEVFQKYLICLNFCNKIKLQMLSR